jgi:hypothetical protein
VYDCAAVSADGRLTPNKYRVMRVTQCGSATNTELLMTSEEYEEEMHCDNEVLSFIKHRRCIYIHYKDGTET